LVSINCTGVTYTSYGKIKFKYWESKIVTSEFYSSIKNKNFDFTIILIFFDNNFVIVYQRFQQNRFYVINFIVHWINVYYFHSKIFKFLNSVFTEIYYPPPPLEKAKYAAVDTYSKVVVCYSKVVVAILFLYWVEKWWMIDVFTYTLKIRRKIFYWYIHT